MEEIRKNATHVYHPLILDNSECQYRLGDEGIESSPEEKNLWVLVD